MNNIYTCKLTKNIQISFLITAVALLMSSCVSKPKVSAEKSGTTQWSLKALVKDTAKNRSSVVNLDVVYKYPSVARIEVSSTMGIHLASLLIKEKEVAYLLSREKKFYEGAMSSKALAPIFSVDLDPYLIRYILYVEAIPGWSCVGDQEALQSCQLDNKSFVSWKRAGDQVTLATVAGSGFEIQIQFREQQKRDSVSPKTFVLSPPKEYQVHKLP